MEEAFRLMIKESIQTLEWDKMIKAHPEYKAYKFWNTDRKLLRGEAVFMVDFTAWGKSSRARGVHLFIDVRDLKLRIFIQWWSQYYSKSWCRNKVYLGRFLEKQFECIEK